MSYLVKPHSKSEADTFRSAAWCKQLPPVLSQVASKDEAESQERNGVGEAQMH